MRDPDRIEKILDSLKKIWKKCPDLRLGQLLLNAARDPQLYYMEDADLITLLKGYYDPAETETSGKREMSDFEEAIDRLK